MRQLRIINIFISFVFHLESISLKIIYNGWIEDKAINLKIITISKEEDCEYRIFKKAIKEHKHLWRLTV